VTLQSCLTGWISTENLIIHRIARGNGHISSALISTIGFPTETGSELESEGVRVARWK
jgi:hypothetical protein